MTVSARFIRRSGILLLIFTLFVAGFMLTGIHRIPMNTVGVIRPANGGEVPEFAEPGVLFVFPLTKRLDVVPLSGSIVMAFYRLGDFNEMKAVEAISADNRIVRLHICLVYEMTAETTRHIIRDYSGIFPQEYITFECGRIMRDAIRNLQADSFRDPIYYNQFLKEMSEQTRRALEQRGIKLDLLQIVPYRECEAEIQDPSRP